MAVNSFRTQIGDKLVAMFTAINTSVMLPDLVTPKFHTDVAYCQRRLQFIDEIEQMPAILLTAASESREYLPSGLVNKHMLFIVRGYILDVNDSDAALNNLIEDVEFTLNEEFNLNRLDGLVNDIRIVEITTDEGLLSPEAVFEMILDATITECV